MLKGKKVAAIITDGFHYAELMDPVNAIVKEGAVVTLIGIKPEHLTTGVLDQRTWKLPDEMKPKDRLKADKLITEVKSSDFDGLLIPGGNAPENMRIIPEIIEFVTDIFAEDKPIAAICHGSMVMTSADIVKGKKMTCAATIAVDLKNAGGIYLNKPLVVDGNIVTSRGPLDIPLFIEGTIKALK